MASAGLSCPLPRMVRDAAWQAEHGLEASCGSGRARSGGARKGRSEAGWWSPRSFSVCEDGGPPIAERINAELIKAKLVPFRPADNKRVPGRGAMGGWDQMRGRLVGDDDGLPMIVMFSTCVDSIRTIPRCSTTR
jgi:hypothetical protein